MRRFSKVWKRRRGGFPRFGNLAVVVWMWGAVGVQGDVGVAIERAREDVEAARLALAEQRERIGGERTGLSLEVERLQGEVRELRERWRDVERIRAQGAAERSGLERRAEGVEMTRRNVLAGIGEFRRGAEAGMSAADVQRHGELLGRLDEALARDEGSGVTLESAGPALELARAIGWEDLATRPFAGYGLDGAGRVKEGRFFVAGPVVIFEEGNGGAWVVVTGRGGQEPMLFEGAPKRVVRDWGEWASGRAGVAPVDVSEGRLVELTRARASLGERLVQGGVVMIPLGVIGVLCAMMVVARWVGLRRLDVDVDPALTRILEALRRGDVEGAREVARGLAWPWREVLADGVEHCRADRAYLEEVLQDRIVMLGPGIHRYLGALAICAAAAPLLGLLGTVTGMIHTFDLITVFGTGDARSLSGGISEALVTTQAGLVIAVPTLLAHAYLARRAKGIVQGLEQAAIRFVRNVGGEGANG